MCQILSLCSRTIIIILETPKFSITNTGKEQEEQKYYKAAL